MNIRLGLERVSAVWWGFWALTLSVYSLFAIVISMRGGSGSDLMGGVLGIALGLPAIYGLHRLSCWVIAGFFKSDVKAP